MKKIIINNNQEYMADKIIKKGNEIALYNVILDNDIIEKMTFPNISNMDDFKLEEGQEWDLEVDEIAQLKISQAEQFETILELLGGMM